MVRLINTARGPFIVAIVFLAGGCATMDEDECRAADWQAIGYEDGARGVPASYIGERREACADHGVTLDFAAYRRGREEGLREYCTPASGFRLGRSGRSLAAVCPSGLEKGFRDAYRSGREIYQAAAVVRSTRTTLDRRQRELEQVRSSLTSKTSELIAPSTGTERRIELLVEIEDLNSRKQALSKEIKRLDAELDRHRTALAALEHASAY